MIRPRLVNVLTVIVIALGAGGILGGYIAFGQYAASEHQGRNEAIATIHEKNATIDKKDAQLARLFDNYVKSVNDCAQAAGCTSTTPDPDVVQQFIEGTPGPAGQNGQNATDAQVFVQVQTFCETTLLCKGDPGAAGAQGDPGQTIVGPQGPQGDPGPAGAQGPVGVDGRGIASTVCDDSGEWQITYTTGETQDAGSCRMSLINP